MWKYTVSIYFRDTTLLISAKNESEAKNKVYEKLKNMPAIKNVIKEHTQVYEWDLF